MKGVVTKRRRWFYNGDVSIEHGGFFYCLESFDEGWVSVYRLQPCSDAGGPENCYWFEELQVITDHALLAFSGVGDDVATRRADRQLRLVVDEHGQRVETAIRVAEDALQCCGGWDTNLEGWDKLTRAQRRHVIVDALVGYGRYDQRVSTMVQVGAKQAPYNKREGEFNPVTILRANVNLRAYVHGLCH